MRRWSVLKISGRPWRASANTQKNLASITAEAPPLRPRARFAISRRLLGPLLHRPLTTRVYWRAPASLKRSQERGSISSFPRVPSKAGRLRPSLASRRAAQTAMPRDGSGRKAAARVARDPHPLPRPCRCRSESGGTPHLSSGMRGVPTRGARTPAGARPRVAAGTAGQAAPPGGLARISHRL